MAACFGEFADTAKRIADSLYKCVETGRMILAETDTIMDS